MSNQDIQYSAKEMEMFSRLGLDDTLMKFLYPQPIYRIAVEKAFIERLEGPVAESLRRTAKAFNEGVIKRMTPEWDDLIRFEDPLEIDGYIFR